MTLRIALDRALRAPGARIQAAVALLSRRHDRTAGAELQALEESLGAEVAAAVAAAGSLDAAAERLGVPRRSLQRLTARFGKTRNGCAAESGAEP